MTPLSYLPGGRIDQYMGHVNFFLIRETTSVREVSRSKHSKSVMNDDIKNNVTTSNIFDDMLFINCCVKYDKNSYQGI